MPPTPLTPEQEARKAQLRAAAARYKRAQEKAEALRKELNELALDTLRTKTLGPTDTADGAGWTTTYLRALARKNDIPADEKYQRRQQAAEES